LFNRAAVDALASKCAVEVDHMQVFKTLVFKAFGLSGWVIVKDGCLVHVTQLEANALTIFKIDCRKEDHGVQSKKLLIRRRPSAWLFSGWNCVPKILSRPTQAVNEPPYSVVANRCSGASVLKW